LAKAHPQPSEGVTYAKKISKEEASIDWGRPAKEIERQIRAFDPWPIAQTTLDGAQLRIWEARAEDGDHNDRPGTVSADHTGIRVATGAGSLNLLRVQLAGRKIVTATEFARARSVAGIVLGAQA
jgi:methionyl-tRNA formyltransferase